MPYQTKLAFLYVAIGASLWGIIGFFVKELSLAGFTSLQIVFLRATSAFLLFLAWIVLKNPALLKIKLKDTWYFLGTGILSVSFFNWCYFTTIQTSSLAIAAILLYTAPAFVLVISSIVFKEKLTHQKLLALTVTFIGCTLVSGLFSAQLELSITSLLIGLGAGFGYSLYSIFGKLASRKYETLTISIYTFFFAMLALFPISDMTSANIQVFRPSVLMNVIGLGLFPTVFAYWFYTQGLKQMDASKAAIVSTIEPVVATLMGMLLYKESISIVQSIGIIFVLGAVLMIQERKGKNIQTPTIQNRH
ncbi:DMT family transporter [Fictibacillus sp. 26RED30]|uniref:DMT family transporter n=1 Tax=Fictibacillus sp. 26RED30 TaxID=2745877 RepID=UPI0018CE3D82|nr:EamA family transporter [Fictibacillus sp. 26RED30]MBH0159628.1 EamA family transporter [Fictibacillus sp. 26RED30]